MAGGGSVAAVARSFAGPSYVSGDRTGPPLYGFLDFVYKNIPIQKLADRHVEFLGVQALSGIGIDNVRVANLRGFVAWRQRKSGHPHQIQTSDACCSTIDYHYDTKFADIPLLQQMMRTKQMEIITFATSCCDVWKLEPLLQLKSIVSDPVIFAVCEQGMQCELSRNQPPIVGKLARNKLRKEAWTKEEEIVPADFSLDSRFAPTLADTVRGGRVAMETCEVCTSAWVLTHFVSLVDCKAFVARLLEVDPESATVSFRFDCSSDNSDMDVDEAGDNTVGSDDGGEFNAAAADCNTRSNASADGESRRPTKTTAVMKQAMKRSAKTGVARKVSSTTTVMKSEAKKATGSGSLLPSKSIASKSTTASSPGSSKATIGELLSGPSSSSASGSSAASSSQVVASTTTNLLSPLAKHIKKQPKDALELATVVCENSERFFWNRAIPDEERGNLSRWFDAVLAALREVGF